MAAAKKTRYAGARNFSAVLREYMAKRETSTYRIAKAIGRSPAGVGHLMRGREIAMSNKKQEVFPYFGDQNNTSKDKKCLRELVVEHLQIPRRAWEGPYLDDKLEWAVEQLRREREVSRVPRRQVAVERVPVEPPPTPPKRRWLRRPAPNAYPVSTVADLEQHRQSRRVDELKPPKSAS